MSRQQILDPNRPISLSAGRCALGIMTKVPEPGKVKTRLTPPLTPEEAARLNICFLQDLASSISEAGQTAPAQGVGIYTPIGAEAAYDAILPADFFLIPQRGHDFGERLLLAARDLLQVGFSAVCLINSDSPTVPASSFAAAANALAQEGDRLVLGPSDDGGYYLIGLRQPHAILFQEIDWSTERVLPQTLARASEAGLEVKQLPRGYDVDDRVTLQRLCQELLGAAPEASDLAPRTRKFLSDIVEREGRDRIWPQ